MLAPLYRQLQPVRRRLRRAAMVRAASLGLLVGGLLFLALAVLWRFGFPVSLSIALAGLLSITFGAGILPALRPRGWYLAARAVDGKYDLKDRVTSALEFAELEKSDPIYELQIADAIQHLQSVNAREVVPIAFPRPASIAAAVVAAGWIMFILPLASSSETEGDREANPVIVEQGRQLDEMIADLQKQAEQIKAQDPSGELQQLDELLKQLPQLKKDAANLRRPDANLRVALANMSKLEMALDKHRRAAELDLAAVDAQLKQLGEAMLPTNELRQAAKALEQQDYKTAAKELEKADPQSLQGMDAKQLADRLDAAAEKMNKAGQNKLGRATKEMAENLRSGEGRQGQGKSKVAAMARNQAMRKQLANMLGAQMASLADSRQTLRTRASSNSRNTSETKSPSESSGKGETGKLAVGKATSLQSKRNVEKVTGKIGEGDSDKELVKSLPGQQDSKRGYRDTFARFQKISEAVLESEPLPLGHRQTIRRYFRSIRPQDAPAPKRPLR